MSDQETEEKPDRSTADVAVVHALALEAAPFVRRCDRVRKYLAPSLVFRGGMLKEVRLGFVQCGMGPERAQRGTRAMIEGHGPKWIIAAGFAGALKPELRVGDIVVAESVVHPLGRKFTIDLKMKADPKCGLYVGRLLSVDEPVRTAAQKQSLGAQHDALAVDMESLAVAEVCREMKIRFLAVRTISDDVNSDLPNDLAGLVDSQGQVSWGAALGTAWRRPASIKEMWRMREQVSHAAERLAQFLEGVVERLYEVDH